MRRKLILLSSDEAAVNVSWVLGASVTILRLSHPLQALEQLKADRSIEVCLVGQAIATAGSADLLEAVRALRPEVRRVVLTDYADLAPLVAKLHTGAIQHLVQTPIREAELIAAVGGTAARV